MHVITGFLAFWGGLGYRNFKTKAQQGDNAPSVKRDNRGAFKQF